MQNRAYSTSQIQDLNAKISSAARHLENVSSLKLRKGGGVDEVESALGQSAKDRWVIVRSESC